MASFAIDTSTRERIHLLLIDDARRGLEDIAAARTHEADGAIALRQQHRAGVTMRPRRSDESENNQTKAPE